MEVILLEDVTNVGKVGELVTVKDGFARNYLIPQKLAVMANSKNLKQYEHQKRLIQEKIEKEKRRATLLKNKIESMSFTIQRQVGEGDKLFGSVTAKDIEENLKEHDIVVDRRTIELDKPIKTKGYFQIPVKLYRDITAIIKLWIVPK